MPRSENPSTAKAKTTTPVADAEEWPGIDSRYRLIVIAALRSKQLQRGAHPRIEPDPRKHRNTSIAVEEVKRGLVPFTITDDKKISDGGHGQPLDPDGND